MFEQPASALHRLLWIDFESAKALSEYFPFYLYRLSRKSASPLHLLNGIPVDMRQPDRYVRLDIECAVYPVAEAVFSFQFRRDGDERSCQEVFEFVEIAAVPVEHIVGMVKIVMHDGRIGSNQFFIQTDGLKNPQRQAVMLAVEEVDQYGGFGGFF